MPDFSSLPVERLPLDQLLDSLPHGSPLRIALLEQTVFAPSSSEFLINDPDDGAEFGVAATQLSNGQAIVIWNDFGDSDPMIGGQLHGKILDAEGNIVGEEFILTSGSSVHFFDFAVAALADGGFAVTWTTSDPFADGDGQAIFAQTFSADGTATSPEIQVNSQTFYNQHWPDVIGLEGGGFVVTWTDEVGDIFSTGQIEGYSGIRAQLFNSAGDRIGSEIEVNTSTLGIQYYPAVAALESGGFVITWSDVVPGGLPGSDIRAQVFSADGEAVGTELIVSSEPLLYNQHSDVAGTSDGGFVAVWRQSDLHSEAFSVIGREFDSPLDTSGSEFLVTEGTVDIGLTPRVVGLPDGGFVVSWELGEPGEEDVYARAYRDWDDPWTDPLLVNTQLEGRQFDAEVSPLGNGFLVSWTDVPPGEFALFGEVEGRTYDLMLA